ncbi:MAG: hypothetical protein K9K66_09965 [Desulfarculaceae bacterium]|nr:hypothetical protein [Desulfarculaceae bacterium]MCF8073734.1 hypothetical protein [Desulfarculaceae bacterium]MCF8101975.1 hypothetical protein [Desulfarculaceae bacterium]MCF8115945.1 hypothetical protein [Desulfarculaceae bacterium]
MRSQARYTRFRLPVVVTMLMVITYLHLRLGPEQAVAHVYLQDFYFLPILLAGFWWGPWWGLIIAAVASGLYLPFILLVHQLSPPLITAGITQMLLFAVVGLVVGWLRRREKSFLSAAQKAENLAAVGRAVASVAHDMKTPLMAIGGFSAQVRRKLPPESSEAHKLDVVVEQTARLESMVKEMLDFSRPLELHSREVDLAPLVAATLEVAAPLASENRVRLTSDLPPDLPLVEADADRLQQALINLVGNAAQASPQEGEVRLSARCEEGAVVLTVTDQGSGVPPGRARGHPDPLLHHQKGRHRPGPARGLQDSRGPRWQPGGGRQRPLGRGLHPAPAANARGVNRVRIPGK